MGHVLLKKAILLLKMANGGFDLLIAVTVRGDLYDSCAYKNQGFHNGRNLEGHILTEHPVWRD